MAMHARPSPIDPYNPTGGETLQHPSPYIPIRIPVFAPVTFLNDTIIRIISVGSRTAANFAGGSSGGSGISTMNDIGSRHRRTLSDGVESVEEGESRGSFEMNSLHPGSSAAPRSRPMSQPKTRVKMTARGSVDRRKLD